MSATTRSDRSPLALKTVGPVAAFTVAYTVWACFVTSRTSNAEFLIYIGVMMVLMALIGWFHCRVRLTTPALWCLSVWGFMHMAGGLVAVPESWPIAGDMRVLYSWWIIPGRLKYDHVVHAYGFGVTTWVCWQGLRAATRRRGPIRPTFGVLVLCVAAGMGFGALNEVVEFAATLLTPETNVGGYVNTGWDLVSNLFGCTAAAVLIRCLHSEEGSETGAGAPAVS
jgi:uncharacterized membrane protein YjdF